jgi:hypothetical protein
LLMVYGVSAHRNISLLKKFKNNNKKHTTASIHSCHAHAQIVKGKRDQLWFED